VVVIAHPRAVPAPAPERAAPDEAAARRTLRGQVARLEQQLAQLAVDASPRDEITWAIGSHGGPRLLGLGELERIRDDLAERLHAVREALAERAEREARSRELLERMLRDPARHRYVRISAADVGASGCGTWESRPRLGLIGMLMGWWHVKISSGCPLVQVGVPTTPRRDEHAGRRWTPRGVSPMPQASPSTPRVAQHPPIALLASAVRWARPPAGAEPA